MVNEKSEVSVTSLIHGFTTFDEEFWSSYKALDELVGDEAKEVKKELMKLRVFKIDYTKLFGLSEKDFLEVKNRILKEWKDKREESQKRGNALDEEKQSELIPEGLNLSGNFKKGGKIRPREQSVFPEVSLCYEDDVIKVKGRADRVIIDGYDVYIIDYKSSKKMETKGFYNQKTRGTAKLKYPLNNIEDTNFWHGTLQVSLYAYMIQQIDPKFEIKLLQLIHYDHDGNCTPYDCEYRKADIIRMLNFKKKEVKNEQFKNARKKIIH